MPVPDELDLEIARLFVQGDQAAFETLFRQFESEVYRWVFRIVRDTGAAEEVVVEAFWRAYRGRAYFDPSRSFGAWMRRIATNVARDHLRAARSIDAIGEAANDITSAPVDDTGVLAAMTVAFGRLPEKFKAVAALALIEKQPYSEIADALDLPIGTVKSRVFRAIRALRKELTRLGIQP